MKKKTITTRNNLRWITKKKVHCTEPSIIFFVQLYYKHMAPACHLQLFCLILPNLKANKMSIFYPIIQSGSIMNAQPFVTLQVSLKL